MKGGKRLLSANPLALGQEARGR